MLQGSKNMKRTLNETIFQKIVGRIEKEVTVLESLVNIVKWSYRDRTASLIVINYAGT